MDENQIIIGLILFSKLGENSYGTNLNKFVIFSILTIFCLWFIHNFIMKSKLVKN